MVKRKVNAKKLKELINRDGLAQFSTTTGVSLSWLTKAMAGGYLSEPRRLVINAICSRYDVDEDELFPVVKSSGKAS